MGRKCRRDFMEYVLFYALCLALFYLSFRYLLWWILPFLTALGAAALLEPIVQWMKRHLHFRRAFSGFLLTLLLLLVVGGLPVLLFTTLWREAYDFLLHLPALFDRTPALLEEMAEKFAHYCSFCPQWLQEYIRAAVTDWTAQGSQLLGTVSGKLLSLLTDIAAAVPGILLGCATTVLAIFFTIAAYPELCRFFRKICTQTMRGHLRELRSGIVRSLARWLRAQATLSALTFVQLLGGFLLIGVDFPLLAAFLTLLVDLLPVFGTGTVLLPWALLSMLFGNNVRAVLLCLLYLCTLLVRNCLEPKLLAASAGLPSVASLFAMYLGYRSFGVAGMILFPFLLLLGKQIYDSLHGEERHFA